MLFGIRKHYSDCHYTRRFRPLKIYTFGTVQALVYLQDKYVREDLANTLLNLRMKQSNPTQRCRKTFYGVPWYSVPELFVASRKSKHVPSPAAAAIVIVRYTSHLIYYQPCNYDYTVIGVSPSVNALLTIDGENPCSFARNVVQRPSEAPCCGGLPPRQASRSMVEREVFGPTAIASVVHRQAEVVRRSALCL